MSSWRKKKQEIGAIHLQTSREQTNWIIPIEFKPRFLVQDLINIAAEKARIRTTAVPFFGLYNRQHRYWLYPFRYLEKSDAAMDWSFRVQFKVKNSVELRRLDSVAFEYYVMQCRSDFVSDMYPHVTLNDALRLACIDILLVTLRSKISFRSALKQFGVKQFIPKSTRELKTEQALTDAINRSFKNFENMTDESAAVRYVEIIEKQLPSFDDHRFKVNFDRYVMGEVISEPVDLTLSRTSGVALFRQEEFRETICSLNDVASVLTRSSTLSVGSGKLHIHLNQTNGATCVFSCDSKTTVEGFCSMVDGYCRLLVDNTKTIVEGVIGPVEDVHRCGLVSGLFVREQRSTNGGGEHVHSDGTIESEVHGRISRDEATRVLQAAGRVDGFYLVRDNGRVKGTYSLSVWIGNDVKHYHIERHSDGYGIQDGLRFATLSQLLKHYHDAKDGLCTKLVKICPPAPTKDSYFIKEKIATEEQPPPVPLSPRPNTQCCLSADVLTVLETVGEGQFGRICLGELKVKDIARDKVKVLLSCLDNASFSVGKQLIQFCATLHRLNHEHIVKYYGYQTSGKSTYLVQEFAPLGPIDEHLAKHKSEISKKFLLGVAVQVAEGLVFLESQSCVHGGITAHSVLLVSQSTIKMSDVGLVAQTAEVTGCDYFNEENGSGRHLLPWLAVECIEGSPLSYPSDIWAAGVFLWELFGYGEQKPFEHLSPIQIKNLVKQGQRVNSKQGRSLEINELMKHCWSDVSTRLSSRDLRHDLFRLSRKADSPNPSVDSLQTTQIGSSIARPGLRRHAGEVQSGVVSSSLYRRTVSDSSQIGLVNDVQVSSPALTPQRDSEIYSSLAKSVSDSAPTDKVIAVQHSISALASANSPELNETSASAQCLTGARTSSRSSELNASAVTVPVTKSKKSSTFHDQEALSLSSPELKEWIIDETELSWGAILGSGQFGVVRKAIWMKPDDTRQETAVKAMRGDADEQQQKEFFREAKAMIALNNPYIVKLLGICVEPSLLLVTELVPLGAVNTYLQSQRHNPPLTTTLIGYCIQIAKGMTYLERHRFVHRDLAARNILVATPLDVKIADFGLSRVFRGDKEYYVATTRGAWPLKWYAPESINFNKFSHKSDVWSYGITIWEIFKLGSEKPYGDMEKEHWFMLVKSGQRLEKPDLCPASVYDVMNSCWEYEQGRRPGFAELCQKMESLQKSQEQAM